MPSCRNGIPHRSRSVSVCRKLGNPSLGCHSQQHLRLDFKIEHLIDLIPDFDLDGLDDLRWVWFISVLVRPTPSVFDSLLYGFCQYGSYVWFHCLFFFLPQTILAQPGLYPLAFCILNKSSNVRACQTSCCLVNLDPLNSTNSPSTCSISRPCTSYS
jgi:hypothetical protein